MAIVALSVVVFSDIGEVCQVVCILTCAMDVADFVFADQFLVEKDDHKVKAIYSAGDDGTEFASVWSVFVANYNSRSE